MLIPKSKDLKSLDIVTHELRCEKFYKYFEADIQEYLL